MKPRKMLGSWDADYIQSLVRLIETQSKTTLANWCIDYAKIHILPIFLKSCPQDARPQEALTAAKSWLAGEIKLPAAKQYILAAHATAREAEPFPAAQAAARAIGQAAATIHAPTHSIGIAYYGAAAVAYDCVGTEEKPEVYERLAAEECARMEKALLAMAVENEPNPAKLNWKC